MSIKTTYINCNQFNLSTKVEEIMAIMNDRNRNVDGLNMKIRGYYLQICIGDGVVFDSRDCYFRDQNLQRVEFDPSNIIGELRSWLAANNI